MTVLLLKDFRQSWRSFRIPALFLILLMFAIMDPLSIRYMGEIVAQFAEGVTIVFPPPSSAQAISTFLGDITEIGLLAVIGTTMGSIASEKASGVTTFIVTKPVSKRIYVLSKFLVLLGALTFSIVAGTTMAALYSLTLIGPVDWVRTSWAMVSIWVYAVFVLSATFAASMTLTSSLAAGGVGLGIHLGIALSGAFLSKSAVGPYLPSSLSGNASAFLLGDQTMTMDLVGWLVKPGVTTLALSLLLLYWGYQIFKRQALP